MDKIIEEKFVKTFVEKSKQNRLLYELFSDNKREKALMRFAHTAREFLKQNLIILEGTKINQQDVLNILKDVNSKCYVISGIYDGEFFKPIDGINVCFEEYMQSILISENFAFIKAESEKGFTMKYLLCQSVKGKGEVKGWGK